MVGGLVTCLIWLAQRQPYVLGLDAAEAGVLVSAALFFGVSMFTKPVPEEGLRPFFPAGTS
jgi:hypothetical protein